METATLDTTTPATTTESAPAAPATSAPDASVTSSERPSSAKELSAWMAKQETDATRPDSPAAGTDPAATVQAALPVPGGTTNPTTDKKGPIPFEVHKKTLDNAYTERDAARTELQTAHAALQKFGPTAQRMASDPIGFLNEFAKHLSTHPTYGPQMRSAAARQLATRAPQTEPQPDVEIVDGNGQVTGRTFSAQGLVKRDAWLKSQLLSEVQKEIGPLKDERARRQASEQAAEHQRATDAHVDQMVSKVTRILGGNDKAHLAAVNKAMADHPDWDAEEAAFHVRETVIAPNLQGKAQLAVVDSFNKKAAGNTANGAGSSATPAKPRTAKELSAWMAARG